MATSCCPTDVKPAINNYKGTGKNVLVADDLDCYIVGDSKSGKAIIVVTDVFGVTPNSTQFSDALAQATGYVVCMPSFIKDPWDPLNIPPTKDGKFPEGIEPADGCVRAINCAFCVSFAIEHLISPFHCLIRIVSHYRAMIEPTCSSIGY